MEEGSEDYELCKLLGLLLSPIGVSEILSGKSWIPVYTIVGLSRCPLLMSSITDLAPKPCFQWVSSYMIVVKSW